MPRLGEPGVHPRLDIKGVFSKNPCPRAGIAQLVERDLAKVEVAGIEGPSIDLIALDEALSKLAEEDTAAAELVKMRFFAGLTLDQIAAIQGVSRRTADRNWAYAKAWLYQEISKTQ